MGQQDLTEGGGSDEHLQGFRVREEGFSYADYLQGVQILEKKELLSGLNAICLPGVGDVEIIEALTPLCSCYHSLLITDEADFYDYLTEAKYFSNPS